MVFDGAAAATVDAAQSAPAPAVAPAAEAPHDTSHDTTPADAHPDAHAPAPDAAAGDHPGLIDIAAAGAGAGPVAPNAPATIVFIDQNVDNIGQIVGGIDPGVEIVLIDGHASGLNQIAAHLSGRTDVGSIHIVSHGEAGTLYLGTDTLTSASLAAHAAELGTIGQSLSADGDILLYGCNAGAGESGRAFLDSLSDLTGADIAASIDNTGGDEAGGDWVLEATKGAIETRALDNPLYAGVLAKSNTGAWSISGLVATNITDGITTTVTFANAGSTTWSTPTNDMLNTVAGGHTATTFDNSAVSRSTAPCSTPCRASAG